MTQTIIQLAEHTNSAGKRLMTKRPLFLKRPYLDIWIGVIVLSLACAALWWLTASDMYVGILIGPWTDVENPNVNLGNASEYPHRPALSSICEYAHFNVVNMAFVETLRNEDYCPIVRFLPEGGGHVVNEKRSADLSILFQRDIK